MVGGSGRDDSDMVGILETRRTILWCYFFIMSNIQ